MAALTGYKSVSLFMSLDGNWVGQYKHEIVNN